MDTLVKADIFFFITAIATVALSILFAIVGVYLILILRDLRDIARRAKTEAEEFMDDFGDIRRDVVETVESGLSSARAATKIIEPSGFKSAIGFLMNTIIEGRSRRRSGGTRRHRSAKTSRTRPTDDD